MTMTKITILLAALMLSFPAWSGDLTVDNLTVSKDAAVYGALNIKSIEASTNGGASATGGTITTNGGYCIHTFTNNSTFTVSGVSLNCDVLVVAGGGGGGGGNYNGGGGGAGGLIYLTSYTVSGENTVTVGAGAPAAAPNKQGDNGSNSVFGTNIAFGGGGGGNEGGDGIGKDGGSGGGSQYNRSGYGDGYPGQGNNGGKGGASGSAGGGGAGAVGADGADVGGNGGAGLEYDISGTPTYYAGGGGGSRYAGSPGTGGSSIGGNGGSGSAAATGGTPYTGSGGGGAERYGTAVGGSGGSGIVIVKYLISSNSYVSTMTVSSNGISQVSASGTNVFMSKVGIGTDNPAEKLHVLGNVRVDGTNIALVITLGGEARTNWPNVAVGALMVSSNLLDVADKAAARDNLGLGSAATNNAGVFLTPTSDGSQLTNITASQVGALSTNAGALIAANNLSELTVSAATARSNLGLGSAATSETSAFLSTAGGVVNGDISLVSPSGDIPMGVYTNQ